MKEKQQKFEVRIEKVDKILSWASLLLFSFICITTKQFIWIASGIFFYMPIIEWILLLAIKDIRLFNKMLISREKISKKINTFDIKYFIIKMSIIFILSLSETFIKNILVNIIIAIVLGIAHSIACDYVKVEKIADE